MNATILKGGPGTVDEVVGQDRWIDIDAASGQLMCPRCKGRDELVFWQEADKAAFLMKADTRVKGTRRRGPRPVGGIHCYTCDQDSDVPPGVQLVARGDRD